MNIATKQDVIAGLSTRVTARLEALSVPLLLVRPSGEWTPLTRVEPLARWIAQAPLVQYALRQAWEKLSMCRGTPLTIIPGVHLVTFPPTGGRRRRRGIIESLPIALLLSSELLESEELHRICESAERDYTYTVAQLNHLQLPSAGQVQGTASLLAWMSEDAGEVERRDGELQGMSQQLAESYEELSLLYKLSVNMSVKQKPNSFLTQACTELREVVGLKWMALQLALDEPRLNQLSGALITVGDIKAAQPELGQVGKALLDYSRRLPIEQQSCIIDDTRVMGIAGLPNLSDHLLMVSLVQDDEPFGLLFGGEKEGAPLSSVDLKLCSSLAGSVSMFLQNLMLYEDMQAMFLGTLKALTRSIDAKDSYTHGHSERVAMMSRMLAQAIGLDMNTQERVHLAGLVHDVGKIGVPEAVLCKPGKLTAEEFNIIKQHPGIGARILSDIRQMRDLIPGVLYHHERWDGRGYPEGRTGTDIPLFGRLIGLTDAFDAMSSSRTYRAAMSHEQVITEILRCSGTQFDAALVQTFVKLDFSPFYELSRTHRLSDPNHKGVTVA